MIKSQDEQVYHSVECLRRYARVWRDAGDARLQSEQFEAMVKEVNKYNPERLQGVARAFTHFLALSNSAENVHRVRRLQQHLEVMTLDAEKQTSGMQTDISHPRHQESGTALPLPPNEEDSFAGCIQRLKDTESEHGQRLFTSISAYQLGHE